MKARGVWLVAAMAVALGAGIAWALLRREPALRTAISAAGRASPSPGALAPAPTATPPQVRRYPTLPSTAPAYPPPPTPVPTPTPTPDSDGYLAAPAFLSTQEITIASSPYAAFVDRLDYALRNHDSTYISGLVSGYDNGRSAVSFGDVWGPDEVAFQGLRAADIRTLLDRFFANGSSLTLQGFFVESASPFLWRRLLPEPRGPRVSRRCSHPHGRTRYDLWGFIARDDPARCGRMEYLLQWRWNL